VLRPVHGGRHSRTSVSRLRLVIWGASSRNLAQIAAGEDGSGGLAVLHGPILPGAIVKVESIALGRYREAARKGALTGLNNVLDGDGVPHRYISQQSMGVSPVFGDCSRVRPISGDPGSISGASDVVSSLKPRFLGNKLVQGFK
jgi:hypothetical protein